MRAEWYSERAEMNARDRVFTLQMRRKRIFRPLRVHICIRTCMCARSLARSRWSAEIKARARSREKVYICICIYRIYSGVPDFLALRAQLLRHVLCALFRGHSRKNGGSAVQRTPLRQVLIKSIAKPQM